MSGTGLQRYFDDVQGLHAHPFFAKTGLSNDLLLGEVFPAIRENEVHFYYGGARLCVYKDGDMHSNNRYLDIPDSGRSRDVRIPSDRYSEYRAIKDKCKEYRSPNKELSIVSSLFSKFSIAASLGAGRARLLDIERRFPGTTEAADAKSRTQDMIDCLFLTPQGTLVFVEVKRADNLEARSSAQSAAVVTSFDVLRHIRFAREMFMFPFMTDFECLIGVFREDHFKGGRSLPGSMPSPTRSPMKRSPAYTLNISRYGLTNGSTFRDLIAQA